MMKEPKIITVNIGITCPNCLHKFDIGITRPVDVKLLIAIPATPTPRLEKEG